MYLVKGEIQDLLKQTDLTKKLYIRPLLDPDIQIGDLSIDLRLGTDFLVSSYGREVCIDVTNEQSNRPISSFFSESRRLIGEAFIFHPGQTVLCSTLEYIKLPEDVFLTLTIRSSYNRVGFNFSSDIIQPGYCGCISIELTNSSNIPVKVLVGARFLQARFFKIGEKQLTEKEDYFSTIRKYSCQVRPEVSKANEDSDIDKLKNLLTK
jgi:dCTP deaminase